MTPPSGAYLKQLRLDAGLSKAKLAELADVGERTITMLESGKGGHFIAYQLWYYFNVWRANLSVAQEA